MDKVQASRPPFAKAWNNQIAIIATGDTFSKPTKRSLTTSKQTNPGAKIINKLFTAPLLRFESPQEARYAPFPNTELPSNVSYNTVCTAFSFSYACYFDRDTKNSDTQVLPLRFVRHLFFQASAESVRADSTNPDRTSAAATAGGCVPTKEVYLQWYSCA